MSIWGWGSRRRAQVEREVREEIVFYLEMRAQEFVQQGMQIYSRGIRIATLEEACLVALHPQTLESSL